MAGPTLLHTDIAVVGAGPTGLLLAGDLAHAGLDVTLLDKHAHPSRLSRAFAVHARTLEHLDARGLADELLATGTRIPSITFLDRLHLDLTHLPTRFPHILVTPQHHTEDLLRRRALDQGVQLETGPHAEVTGLHHDHDSVRLQMRDGTTVRAAYAVGADGVHSTVRSLLGLPYPGRTVIDPLLVADAVLDRPAHAAAASNAHGFAFLAPFGRGQHRIIAWDRAAPAQPPTAQRLQRLLTALFGPELRLGDVRDLTTFTSEERQSPHYRVGRVFLIGDAAHCHSPVGGLGMNTGLHDAANLSWKLAAAHLGHTGDPDALLDSYHRERHPAGRQAIRISGTMLRAIALTAAPARHLRAAALTVADHASWLTHPLTRTLAGLTTTYPQPHGHPLAGTRIRDLPLASTRANDPTRVYEALRSRTHLLLTSQAEPAPLPPGWHDRVHTISTAEPHPTALIRPDAHIAWAAHHPPGTGELRAVLATHLGPPTP